MEVLSADERTLQRAAQLLAAGRLVAFPTETVYGLGADAMSADAIRRLYEAKGRPTNHPVIVHLASIEQLSDWVRQVPDEALRLGEKLWPGPLTMVLPKAAHVPAHVTGGQDSVGIRIPRHPVALALLKAFGGGVAAPSANKFGRLSPTTAADVAAEFAQEVDLVIDGGSCDVGIESTIVDFTGSAPRILRPGMILPEQIESIISARLDSAEKSAKGKLETRAPGGLPSHYAPVTPLQLVASDELNSRIAQLEEVGKRVCVLAFQSSPRTHLSWIQAPANAAEYAQSLYRNLRRLDRERASFILVESVPQSAEWAGISDRLKRAAADATRTQAELLK